MTSKRASTAPADQSLRTRFVSELDRNFSVLAPAGVGKTKAIVDRVVAIATADPERASAWLPKLAVVTYTNKAADEMYQRARNAIIEQRVGLPVLTQFNHAFFGTIHSFCVRLLRTHGHLCGLPAQFEPVEDDEELWQEFVRQTDRLAPALPPALVRAVTRLMPMDSLLALARGLKQTVRVPDDPATLRVPVVDLRGLLAQTADKRSAVTIERSQRAAQDWQTAWTSGRGYAPLPRCATKAKDFAASWERAFGPLRDWLGAAALRVALDIATAYRAYRRQRGVLTYDDQIELAWDLVRDPVAGRRLREEGFRVILDEAQDTDPLQFNILLELARPATVASTWMATGGPAPEPGRFCMVGDPQQSIYGQRADLGWYEKVRQQLVAAKAADEVVFSVTFRCDQAIIDAVNALVAPMFQRTEGQVTYHQLTARPDAGPGQVVRWTPELPARDDLGVGLVSLHEARQLAAWLRENGPAGLGAASWSEVAVLCPRTRWLQTMAAALREAGLVPQVHSERFVQADHPVYAWFTALLTVLARPDDAFEIVGVLREIYGLADETLALYAKGDGAAWSIARTPEPGDEVARVLAALAELRDAAEGRPLRDAARLAVQRTALAQRLAALPAHDVDVDEALEALLVRAAMAEDAGLSLAEFAEQLREGMEAVVPARPVMQDAVQLLTCHKAKGLQWDVVVLPLLFRSIGEKTGYPVLIRTQPGEPPEVALSANDLRPLRERVELRRRQEHQRLLYVALTRAKRTLVVVDDDRLFARKKQNRSFADMLGMIDEQGHRIFNEAWNALADRLRKGQAAPAVAVAAEPQPLEPLTADAWRAAQACARILPRRVLPYQLGEAEARAEMAMAEPEGPRSAGAEAARAYGIWWHEAVEHLDWRASASDMRLLWEEALKGCPDAARGRREGDLLLASDFARALGRPGLILHREMPILWRRSADECVEGIVDLAVWDPDEGRWLIADWKTNVVRAEETSHLRKIYEPQLRAYAEAVKTLSGAPIEAGVFSTTTGLWIPCVTLA